MRLPILLSLSLLLAAATPVHQLEDVDPLTGLLQSPTPTASPSPSTSILPTPSISAMPDTSLTPVPTPTSDASPTALASPTPVPEGGLPLSTPTPLPTPTIASSPSPSEGADALLPPIEDDDDDEHPFGDDDDDDDADDPLNFGGGNVDEQEGNEATDEPDTKAAEGGLLSAPGSISAVALVGVAVAILAPAVIIYWFVRRRNQSTGFENMPEVEQNTYRGSGRDTFTVA